jgi:hypothetical protein
VLWSSTLQVELMLSVSFYHCCVEHLREPLGRKIYFRSWFQSLVSLLYCCVFLVRQNIIVAKVCVPAKLLTSWQPGSREKMTAKARLGGSHL